VLFRSDLAGAWRKLVVKKKHMPKFGSHMSAAGGLENAFHAGVAVGCDALQLFVKNQRQWRAASLSDEQIQKTLAAKAETGLTPVVAHASYLLNLASPEDSKRKQSVEALVDEQQRCESVGVDFVVVHPGAHMDDTMEAGISRVAQSLDEVEEQNAGLSCMVLLETTAGQGSAIGYRFEQIAGILNETRNASAFGVCLDTCHLFAAGYDFRKQVGYDEMMNELDQAIGISKVKCIHVNDSKKDLGSRVDRHDHIGKGKIGIEGFAHFVNDTRFGDVPFILETPKGKDGRGADFDKVNLKRLRALVR